MHIIVDPGAGSFTGNTRVVSDVDSSLLSIANVRSPVETTLITRFTPMVLSESFFPTSLDFLRRSSRGPPMACKYASSGNGGGTP